MNDILCSEKKTTFPTRLLFKLGEHVGHHGPTLDGFLRAVVVFEQSKHVPAVLHGQAADQFLHHLTRDRTDINPG